MLCKLHQLYIKKPLFLFFLKIRFFLTASNLQSFSLSFSCITHFLIHFLYTKVFFFSGKNNLLNQLVSTLVSLITFSNTNNRVLYFHFKINFGHFVTIELSVMLNRRVTRNFSRQGMFLKIRAL